jgi:SDR family mycofactocin-dependent oxidoreductase
MGMLDGKVAFITGAARGQGRAHAVTCAREGADVIVVDLNDQLKTVPYELAASEDLAETVRQVEQLDRQAVSMTVDVRDQTQLDEAVERGLAQFGQIDILIANAGIWTRTPFWELTEEQWDEMIGVNLTGVWKSAKAVAPHMIERESGSIVVVSSVNGLEPGVGFAHYVAAKHGLVGLMKNIALELAPFGIRCNSIHPGAILTPMIDHQEGWDNVAGHEGGTKDEMLEGAYHFHALKGATALDPQVIADTALFLNSSLAANVTGATIPVDAGHMILSGFNHEPVR